MKSDIDFLPGLALADCAARVFAKHRTKDNAGETHANARKILRSEAVVALRYLWRTGSADQRSTVACRVAVWMKRPLEGFGRRILERERQRLKK